MNFFQSANSEKSFYHNIRGSMYFCDVMLQISSLSSVTGYCLCVHVYVHDGGISQGDGPVWVTGIEEFLCLPDWFTCQKDFQGLEQF